MRHEDERGGSDQFHAGERQEEVPMDAVFRDADVISGESDADGATNADQRQKKTRTECVFEVGDACLYKRKE